MVKIDVDKQVVGKGKSSNICYHYTSPDALINMISESSLRFTHCEFLNDVEEFNYIGQLLNDDAIRNDKDYDFIKLTYENAGNDNSGLYYKEPISESRFYHMKKGNYYVFSTSKEKDSLPMWSYYSKTGNYYGYSIKLDIKKIAKGLEKENGLLLYGNVIYDKDEQVRLILNKVHEITDKLKSKLRKNNNDEPLIGDAQEELFDFIQMIRIFFKRYGFKHEKEIRIALLTNPSEDLEMGFNSINGLVRPYVEYKFEKLPINEIIMSPSIEFELARKGLLYLLKKNGYIENVDPDDEYNKSLICKSSIKLRF